MLTAAKRSKASNEKKLYQLRADLSRRLAAGVVTVDAAILEIARSPFLEELRVAGSRDAAVESLAELLVLGNNAISHSTDRNGVLYIDVWRE